MRGEFAIKRPPCNAEVRTDTLHRTRAGLVEVQCHRKRLRINGFLPSSFPASLSRTGQPCQGPLSYEMTFEFGKRACDLEKELSYGSGRINHLDQALESDVLLV